MVRSNYLFLAATAISDRKDEGQKYWQICYHKKKIQCLPSTCTAKPEIVFLTISADDCDKGLSGKQWSLLTTRLYKFFERN